MSKRIGRTDCGWLFLTRWSYGHKHSISVWRAKKLILRAIHKLDTISDSLVHRLEGEEIDGYPIRMVKSRSGDNAYIDIGCQVWSLSDLKAICRYYGWKF